MTKEPVTQGDVDAFTRSLRVRDTPWAHGCADVLESLWAEVYLARSRAHQKSFERGASHEWVPG